MKRFIEDTILMNERPGLQSITYIAKHDFENTRRLVPAMCERALN